METTHVSETSTLFIHTPGNYRKEDNIRFSQHGESLKTRLLYILLLPRSGFLRIRNMSGKKVVEKAKTHIICNILWGKIVPFM
jgi:hypothetical protein